MVSNYTVKNKELVSRMSLEQQIRLITSTTFWESRAVENYKFPVFKLSSQPAADAEGLPATLFPSDKALACAWNAPLVKDVYRLIGNEAKANVSNPYFATSNDLQSENVSEDYFLTGSFLAQKARGVNLSGAYVNYDNVPEEDERVSRELNKQITDLVLRESEPDSLLLHSVEEVEKFPELYGYKGLLYGVAATKEDVARYLYHGCAFVFLEEDFMEELTAYLTDLTLGYEKAKKDYEAGKITLAEFDRRHRNLEILDASVIEAACDKAVSALLDIKACNAVSIEENPVSLSSSRAAKFNEKFHDLIAYRAAQQSAILLKNCENTLPLNKKTAVAVIGEYAKNPEYQTELTQNSPTKVRLPFEVINQYEINAIGYAHGYLKGQSGREDLRNTALTLCNDADYALVYLSADRDADKLPQGQLELVSVLAEHGVKIIAVVSADGVIDLSFTQECEAVLFTYRGGQASANAVLDIITGKICPSGKLIETFPVSVENYGYGKLPAYCKGNQDGVLYPFGFGLTYTQFEYRNLKITENGVSCTVFNTGDYDGFATVQLYCQKEDSESTLSEKLLRGFAKVFVKKNDAVKVEIPFDGDTFRTYDPKTNHFRVEGGEYQIYIAECANAVKLSGKITLAGYEYKQDVYRNEPVLVDETAPVGFTATPTDAQIRKAKKSLSFGLKLFLAITLMVYYTAVGAVLLFTTVVAEKTLAFYISVGVVLAVGDALGALYIVLISKKRKLQHYMHPSDVLSDMVDQVSEFEEIAKVSFVEPVPAEEEEPEEEEAFEETEEIKADGAMTYETAFGEREEEETSFADQVSFSELCASFRAYALERGVSVEQSSVRAIFAAISASKLVFLSCKNKEALPVLLEALNAYFGNTQITTAGGDWQSPNDLLWQRGEDKFVTSEFANTVNSACKNSDKNCIAVIDNVEIKNLSAYFGVFVEYALHPSEKHTLALNGELSLELPDNICYFLVPASEDYAEEVPPELARASLQIDVIASKAEAAAEGAEIKTVSRTALSELVSEAREKCFLPEKVWKKIDGLTEAIGATERFVIGNKDILQLEKYSAVLLESGGDESEAAVGIFTAKIVPLLKGLKAYRKEDGGKTIYGIIEKLFGEEDISKIQRLLVHGA